MTIGERIKEIRKERGLSQAQMAAKLNISAQNYAQYEALTKDRDKNVRTPKYERLSQIADILGVSVDDLLGIQYEDNVMDREDTFTFFSSMGYRIKQISDTEYNVTSRDITNHINATFTYDELREIYTDIWKYLRFDISEKIDEREAKEATSKIINEKLDNKD